MEQPTLVFDDDCGFCTWWATVFAERDIVQLVGFSDLEPALEDRLPREYESCAHLVTDEAVYSCGASLEEVVRRADGTAPAPQLIDFLRQFEDYEQFREGTYRFIADHRDVFGQLLSKTPPARDSAAE